MGDTDDSWRGRRDVRWMMMWPLSSLVGGAYGFTLVWVAVLAVSLRPDGELALSMSRYLGRSIAFGLAYAIAGAVCGLAVALALTFLVGDAHGRPAERMAFAVGAGIHAVAALVVLVLLGGTFGLALWLVLSSVAVGLVAGWWHRRLARSPRVEGFDAH